MIIGNLGRDPETRYTANGNPVTSFSVAVNRVYTAGGERREETEWFRVSAWNKLAETCSQYLHKGSRVYVEGRLKTSTWDAADGQKRLSLEVTASDMIILDTKGRTESGDVAPEEAGGSDLDSIPF